MTTFHTTTDPKQLHELFAINGKEWGGPLSPDQFADMSVKTFGDYVTNGRKPKAYYLRDQQTKDVLSLLVIVQSKGYYKGTDRAITSNALPDPSSIGVANITMLLVSYVFTNPEHRGKGFAETLLKKTIEEVETALIEENIASSKPDKSDSFKAMVTDSEGNVDRALANYYLSKKYFWYLYSAIGTFYERFGFKPFPFELYKIPSTVSKQNEEQLFSLLNIKTDTAEAGAAPVGKKLRLLRRSNKQDLELIDFIYKTKELDILTELNKSVSHSELSGSGKSQSSLTNMSDILQLNKLSSATNALSLGSINETKPSNDTSAAAGSGRRKSSVIHSSVPKVALKPDFDLFKWHADTAYGAAQYSTKNKERAVEFGDIQGAVLTNDLQQKSYYILWASLMQKQLVILSVGELKSDFFSSIFESPSAGGGQMGGVRSRRGSSFTGINDLGGFNFQDLDILFNLAGYVARNRNIPDQENVYVTVNDLPSNIPSPVLHDYFLNYTNQQYSPRKVEFFSDGRDVIESLPMLKRFGENSPEFQLDWFSSGIWSWS